MVLLIQAVAAVLLLLGSGLIVRALIEIDREPMPAGRPASRPGERGDRLRRAA